MAGPYSWTQLKRMLGRRLYVAPLGTRPKPTEPYFRVIHDATAPGLNASIQIPGHVRRPMVEDLRTALRRRLGEYLALVLDTKDAHRTFSVKEQDWGCLACTTAEPGARTSTG